LLGCDLAVFDFVNAYLLQLHSALALEGNIHVQGQGERIACDDGFGGRAGMQGLDAGRPFVTFLQNGLEALRLLRELRRGLPLDTDGVVRE
jgi:hypothetical protein